MKVTVLAPELYTTGGRRANRLALAARTFAEVNLIGPARYKAGSPAIPQEPWITAVRKARFPQFAESFIELVELADGDVLIAVKPHLASFGVALVAAERRGVPLILDLDDLDVAFRPRSTWASKPKFADLSRPESAVYVSLLTRAVGAASAITVVSTALRERFGGTLIPQVVDTEVFNPSLVDRDGARREFGFIGPTVLFPGTPTSHKGLKLLAEAVSRVAGARLVVTCRPEDLAGPEWERFPLDRMPQVAYSSMPAMLAAADVVAIPQLDREVARHQSPLKLFDAMAMAKPIVASSVPDLPLVLDGCGRLVPPGDVDALAAAISQLLSGPDESRLMGERARARCLERYSIPRIGERLSQVVSRVTRG
jgi:glycosyltransferase involved in cell wall biosynthesis